MSLFGFIPLVSPSFADAQENIYVNSGVDMSVRAKALVTLIEGRPSTWLILLGFHEITPSADISSPSTNRSQRDALSPPSG
jgi:hypothetical protein